MPEVGEVWRTRDAESGSRIDFLWTSRFLTGHCHVGAFALPWAVDEWVGVPGVGPISLEIIFCGIVEGFPRSGNVWF